MAIESEFTLLTRAKTVTPYGALTDKTLIRKLQPRILLNGQLHKCLRVLVAVLALATGLSASSTRGYVGYENRQQLGGQDDADQGITKYPSL